MKKNLVCLVLAVVTAFNVLLLNVNATPYAGVSAKSAIVIDAQTGKIICEKNANKVVPMASTTKIMTTLLMLESGNLDEEFVVDSDAIKIEGSSMGLVEGDIVTKRALCYGMMLPSGNDAANATAVKLAGGYEAFAEMMNARAKKIGMLNTNFVTPSGLHDDKHYSTAYDMALLTREAMKNETFCKICSTTSIKLQYGNPPYDRWLSNSNRLLNMYPYCIGVKTGFTDEAGRCLISSAEKDGIRLICVTLNAPNDWNDHMAMLDYGFSVTKKYEMLYDTDITEDIVGGDCDTIKLVASDIPAITVVNSQMPEYRCEVIKPSFVYAPVVKGNIIGRMNFYIDDKIIETVDLLADGNSNYVEVEVKKSVINKITDYLKQLF